MNYFEYFLYSLLFLFHKYFDWNITDYFLNKYENKMIQKYVSKKEIESIHIPTIDAEELTDLKFKKISNNYRNPVLIKGYLKNSYAIQKWTPEYLREIIGDFNINVLDKDKKVMVQRCAFHDFIETMKSKNIYINNNHTILTNFPQLFNDIKIQFNNFLNTLTSTNLRNIHIANLFIGYNKKNTVSGSNMHCGGSGNFFCMIKGKKHWTLMDPKYSCFLKGRVAESGIHAQTLFDMPDTDLSSYPKMFKHLPRYDVTLEPGDILWNAPWWWHRIENTNQEGINIGMAIRNNKVTKLNFQNNFTYTMSGYTYLLYNTIFISIYEKLLLRKDKHFNIGDEQNKSNVLYQIEKLIKKYPKTILYSEIINKETNVSTHPKNE